MIVADEPVSALDVSIRAQVLNLMKRLQATHDLSYVVISHDLAVVKYLADRIGVMYLGKMVELGSGRRHLRARRRTRTPPALIETIPIPDPQVEQRKRGRRHQRRAAEPGSTRRRAAASAPAARSREAKCAEEEPPLRLFGTGHAAACHFPLQTPVAPSAVSTGDAAPGEATATL